MTDVELSALNYAIDFLENTRKYVSLFSHSPILLDKVIRDLIGYTKRIGNTEVDWRKVAIATMDELANRIYLDIKDDCKSDEEADETVSHLVQEFSGLTAQQYEDYYEIGVK